jgi:hypothetical protein
MKVQVFNIEDLGLIGNSIYAIAYYHLDEV